MTDDEIACAVLRLVRAIHDELYPPPPAEVWHPEYDRIEQERRSTVREVQP